MSDANYLVIFIPGFGGSELADADGERVWYGGAGSLVEAAFSPEALAVDQELAPIGLLTDFALVPFFKSIRGYSKVWEELCAGRNHREIDHGHPEDRNLEAKVVAFPYDFRKGVPAIADRLRSEIRDRRGRLGEDTKVIIASHSMGGSVARHWVALEAVEKDGDPSICVGIVTAGTPHRGAPKALDGLLNGVETYVTGRFSRPIKWATRSRLEKMTTVATQWPAVYDLAPTTDCVFDIGDDRWATPASIMDFPHAARLAKAEEHGSSFVLSAWKELRERPDGAPPVIPLVGYGHETTSSFRWDGETLRADTETLDGPESGHAPGDGTVPLTCALPWEFTAPEQREICRRTNTTHGEFNIGHHLRDAVGGFTAKAAPTRGRWDDAEPNLRTSFADIAIPNGPVGEIALVNADLRLSSIEVAWADHDQSAPLPAVAIDDDGVVHVGDLKSYEGIGMLDITVNIVTQADARLQTSELLAVDF